MTPAKNAPAKKAPAKKAPAKKAPAKKASAPAKKPAAKKAAASSKKSVPAVRAALLLTPGASATRDHSALVAIDDAVTALGVAVRRIDLPGSRVERAITVAREEAADLADQAGVAPDRVFLGGRSFGGRVCSMAVADGLPAAGLVLVSYPLHPPGRPADARTAHLPALLVPCLFVSGTRDQFGTPDELEAATKAIPGPVTHVWIEGGNHGLRGKDAEVAAAVRDWITRQL